MFAVDRLVFTLYIPGLSDAKNAFAVPKKTLDLLSGTDVVCKGFGLLVQQINQKVINKQFSVAPDLVTCSYVSAVRLELPSRLTVCSLVMRYYLLCLEFGSFF